MLICKFCSEEGTHEDFELDIANGQGFWCESCDGFTYFDKQARNHRFTLIMEDKNTEKPTFSPSPMKFRKQLSPLRFPGGKSKSIDYLFTHLQQDAKGTLVSPFTGGGSFELAMLDAGVFNRLHLNDLDYGVYSLWWTILNAPFGLIDKIRMVTPSHKEYFRAQAIIKEKYYGVDTLDAAWATLLVNRLAYSGIAKANPLGGRRGKKQALLARWNPTELINRIEYIHSFSEHIDITCENAIDLIEQAYWSQDCIFIDPPYVAKGKDLYNCYYTKQDHIDLSLLLDSLYQGMPGADLLVTYDYNKWLQSIYHHPTEVIIGCKYSI